MFPKIIFASSQYMQKQLPNDSVSVRDWASDINGRIGVNVSTVYASGSGDNTVPSVHQDCPWHATKCPQSIAMHHLLSSLTSDPPLS